MSSDLLISTGALKTMLPGISPCTMMLMLRILEARATRVLSCTGSAKEEKVTLVGSSERMAVASASAAG